MKVLLICAGGLSTDILKKKMMQHAESKGIPFEVVACGIMNYKEICNDYDVIMIGPQVSYKKAEVEANSNQPIGVITAIDYATGNAGSIFNQIEKLLSCK